MQNRYMYYEYFFISHESLWNFNKMYLANVKSNYNVILEINDRNYSGNRSYKITFCENQDISYYIPAIKCPKYSKKSESNKK